MYTHKFAIFFFINVSKCEIISVSIKGILFKGWNPIGLTYSNKVGNIGIIGEFMKNVQLHQELNLQWICHVDY